MNILKVQLEDNMKAHVLQPDGTYEKPDRRGRRLSALRIISARMAAARAAEKKASPDKRVFIPAEPVSD